MVGVGAPRTGLRPWGENPEWRARQVPNTLDRLARGRRLPERTEKARSLGRPPERLEVGPERAQRLRAFVLGFRIFNQSQERRCTSGIRLQDIQRERRRHLLYFRDG